MRYNVALFSADSGFFDGNMWLFCIGLVQNRFYGGNVGKGEMQERDRTVVHLPCPLISRVIRQRQNRFIFTSDWKAELLRSTCTSTFRANPHLPPCMCLSQPGLSMRC